MASVGKIPMADCGVCGGAEQGKLYCFQCKQHLCKTCGNVHAGLSVSATHTVISVDSADQTGNAEHPTENQQPAHCDLHPRQQLAIYCFDCQVALCSVCCAAQHKQHNRASIEDDFERIRMRLQNAIDTIKSAMMELAESLETVGEHRAAFTEIFEKTTETVCDRADQLTEFIAQEKQSLLDELAVAKSDHENHIDAVVNEIKQKEHVLEKLTSHCGELLAKGSPSVIAFQLKSIRDLTAQFCVQDLTQGKVANLGLFEIGFVHDDMETIRKKDRECLIGRIITKRAEDKLTDSRSPTPTLTHSIVGTRGVSAIAQLGSKLFVTRDEVREVMVYDANSLQLEGGLAIDGFSSDLRGLAACAINNCLYVSDCTNKAVHKVVIELSKSKKLKTTSWPVEEGPRGLSVNAAGNVLVAYLELKKIQEYTTSGKLVREISDDSHVWQGVELSSGNWLIVRNGPLVHGLREVSCDEDVVGSYGNKSGLAQLNNPRCVQASRNGFVLVADCNNHRIVVVNAILTQARQLDLNMEGTINQPFGLCYDEARGRLYVGEWGGQYRILAFDNVVDIDALFQDD